MLHADPTPENPPTTRHWLRQLGPAGPLAVGALVLPIVGGVALLGFIKELAPWFRAQGAAGPALAAAAFAVLAGPCLIPTYAVSIVCGWSFGAAVGLPAAVLGMVGASLVGYAIARPLVGDRLLDGLRRKPRWDALRRAMLASGAGRALLIVSLVRLAPIAPFGITNLLLASARCALGPYALGTLLGMIPRIAVLVFAAAGLEELSFEQAPWTFVSGIVLAVVALVGLGIAGRKALARVTAAELEPDAPAATT